MNLLARHFDLTTGGLLGQLLSGYELPQVKVTSELPETTFKPIDGKTRPDLAWLVATAQNMAADQQGVIPAHAGPLAQDGQARRQFSFSQLTGELQRDAPEPAATAEAEYILAEPISDALGLGTLVHAVLADSSLPTGGSVSGRDVEPIVQRHAERQLFELSDEIQLATEMVLRFVQSPLATRLRMAAASYVELEFLLGWPPGEANDGEPYLSGFIDRLWQDDHGDWHVLDFKTNRVTPDKLASTAAKYELQMLLYALAVEQNLGVSPKSLTLYFLRTGDEHTFAWNPAARQRVVEKVSAAIAAARARNGLHPA
jgi:ATP-dependent exoDNAse (exonuclease V) beta subunit